MQKQWHYKPFLDLTPTELYHIMQLRQEVFVVEQACVYQDADGWDEHASHLFCTDETGQVIAYSRLFHEKVKYEAASVGRIVVKHTMRQTGLGRELVQKSLAQLKSDQQTTIYFQAQAYLESFYSQFGLVTTSDPYLEDDILHVDMYLSF